MTSGRAALVASLVLENFPHPKTAMALSPNGRVHWRTKNDAKDVVANTTALRARHQHLTPMRGFVTMQPVWTFPDHRKRDDDNLGTGVMKAVRDALVRGGWLEADDTEHLRQLPAEVRVVKGQRSLELRFEWSAESAT